MYSLIVLGKYCLMLELPPGQKYTRKILIILMDKLELNDVRVDNNLVFFLSNFAFFNPIAY